jgi:nucleoside-diphosphate-sugar epimerase
MRILVTGGCGFVGSQLVQLLIQHTDHTVHILDNELSGPNRNPAVYLITTDIRDKAAMHQLIPSYDIVVHLAGIVGVPACSVDEQFAFDVNVTGTQNIVRSLRSDAKIIFTSSTSAYGNKVNELVTEESTLTPLTNYGLHKLYGETEIKRHIDNYIIVRPATAFGISQRTRLDVLPNTLIFDALTKPRIDIFEPRVIRPFIHVYDFARVLLFAVQNKMPWKNVYNIGDSNLTMQKGDLARKIAKMANTEVVLMEGNDPDKRNYDVSFQKLYNTGFYSAYIDALPIAFGQIRDNLEEIKANYSSYNTPYHVKEYLRIYGNTSY